MEAKDGFTVTTDHDENVTNLETVVVAAEQQYRAALEMSVGADSMSAYMALVEAEDHLAAVRLGYRLLRAEGFLPPYEMLREEVQERRIAALLRKETG